MIREAGGGGGGEDLFGEDDAEHHLQPHRPSALEQLLLLALD